MDLNLSAEFQAIWHNPRVISYPDDLFCKDEPTRYITEHPKRKFCFERQLYYWLQRKYLTLTQIDIIKRYLDYNQAEGEAQSTFWDFFGLKLVTLGSNDGTFSDFFVRLD